MRPKNFGPLALRFLPGIMRVLPVVMAASRAAAITLGQQDTFQDGTSEGWSGNAPQVISTGGPKGAGDEFLEVIADGNGGMGSKLITYNDTQWLGNYATAGVNLISMDLMDFAKVPLQIRLAFRDTSSAGYSSTNAFVVPADSAWHPATFAVSAAAMTAVNSPAESFDDLVNSGIGPADFRILDSAAPALKGDSINAALGIDNITALSAGPAIASSTWNASSGTWEDTTKWLSGVPAYGAGQTASFPNSMGSPPAVTSVTLTANKIVGNLSFTSTIGSAYSISSSNGSTLTLNNNGSGSSINVALTAGNVTIAAPLVLADNLTVTTNGATSLTIAGGITGTGGIIKAGTAAMFITAPVAGSGIVPLTLNSLSITAGTFALNSAVAHSDRTLLITSGLSLTGGQLDLGSNDAIVHVAGGTLATIQPLIARAFNNGNWNGAGPSITSSTAHADSSLLTALGAISGMTSFDGQSVLSTDVLLKYTYYGDANLDGKVDGSDYARIDSGYLTRATGWYNGDFNYDNAVNGSDYTLIDNVFNRQGVSLAAGAAVQTAAIAVTASLAASVPEPATFAVLLWGATMQLSRRRQKKL